MRRHLAYARYLLAHKWWVLVAGLRIGVPLWRLLVHDWSKFLPSEWVPYARTFYARDGSKRYEPNAWFDHAWLHHQHRNSHHWQHWLLREDSGGVKMLCMPVAVAKEMVADWAGAGRAITGRWGAVEWYSANRDKIQINPVTRILVERVLPQACGKEVDDG